MTINDRDGGYAVTPHSIKEDRRPQCVGYERQEHHSHSQLRKALDASAPLVAASQDPGD